MRTNERAVFLPRPVLPAILLPALMLALAGPAGAQIGPELIVHHARIYTADPAVPSAEALAVSGGEIVAVGDEATVMALATPATQVVDAGGRTVIPGLIDAHAHVMGLGRAHRILDLVGTQSAGEVVETVRSATAERSADEWITGRGWDQNDWEEKRFPSHAALDAVAPGNPVYLTRVDGHAGWANARAMELAGISADTPDPPGGRIERDDRGQPTGVFIDNAQALVASAIPLASGPELEARLAAAMAAMAAVGLTGAHDMGVNQTELELYREWSRAGRLTARLVVYLGYDRETLDWLYATGATSVGTEPHSHLRVVGFKFYADGALGSRGAALLAPYSDDPGNTGLLVTDADSLAAGVVRAIQDGLQPAIHAIGDRGNRVALDAIEAGERARLATAMPTPCAGSGEDPCAADPDAPLRPRIEHAQVVALEDIPRFAELGVVASMQPTHATSDMYWAEDRVGPERIRGAYAWRRMRDAGVTVACGSDFPVESPNPFIGLYAAVTRQDLKGWPEGGWRPEERMSREEALACFTRDAARVVGMEDEVGSLTVGKRADFLILDRDPMTVPADQIWGTKVLRTVVDGRTVFEAGQ